MIFLESYATISAQVSFLLVKMVVNTSRQQRMTARYFADDHFKCIFLNENIWISIDISLKNVLKGQISNIPALVQIMAWCLLGARPLSEPMMIRLLTQICVTRPYWVKRIEICIQMKRMTQWSIQRKIRNIKQCDFICFSGNGVSISIFDMIWKALAIKHDSGDTRMPI